MKCSLFFDTNFNIDGLANTGSNLGLANKPTYTLKMALKDLCRLCGKEDMFSKDLLLESNKGTRKIIQDFIQIIVRL